MSVWLEQARSFPNGVVATPHYLASSAGLAMLASGGNAVDAALAANLVLAVVTPYMCGVGGDLLAIVWDGDVNAYRGVGRAPADATLEQGAGRLGAPTRCRRSGPTRAPCPVRSTAGSRSSSGGGPGRSPRSARPRSRTPRAASRSRGAAPGSSAATRWRSSTSGTVRLLELLRLADRRHLAASAGARAHAADARGRRSRRLLPRCNRCRDRGAPPARRRLHDRRRPRRARRRVGRAAARDGARRRRARDAAADAGRRRARSAAHRRRARPRRRRTRSRAPAHRGDEARARRPRRRTSATPTR